MEKLTIKEANIVANALIEAAQDFAEDEWQSVLWEASNDVEAAQAMVEWLKLRASNVRQG